LLALGVCVASLAVAGDARVLVGSFSRGSLEGWEKKSFKGETAYAIAYDSERKATVLNAIAAGTASGRFRRIKIDLTKTPFLNWSWKVSKGFVALDENTRAGDDFAARVYVVVERGILGLSSLSVNYVWASQHAVGSAWPSPFTSHVRLVAVDSGSKRSGIWVDHKRNVRADLKEQFGEDIPAIDAVALMTDADNSGGRAEASYGDIWFSAE